MLPALVMNWMNEHKFPFTANDPGLDGMQFIWIGSKRLFAVGEEYVIIPSSYYDRVTGFINTSNGPQVWHAGDPDLFEKLERFINDCS